MGALSRGGLPFDMGEKLRRLTFVNQWYYFNIINFIEHISSKHLQNLLAE